MLSDAARAAAIRRVSTPQPDQMLNADRLWWALELPKQEAQH